VVQLVQEATIPVPTPTGKRGETTFSVREVEGGLMEMVLVYASEEVEADQAVEVEEVMRVSLNISEGRDVS
jgi:hypothetical protein